MEASSAGTELSGRRARREEGTGEIESPNAEPNEEGEGEDDEEEEEVEDEDKGMPVGNPDSLDDDKDSDLSEMDQNLRTQVLQLLDELEETREMALKYEDDSLELQGLLEDERLASARQAEIFTKQIQRLQAQMRSLRDEFDSTQELKNLELERLERELQEAHEEIHSLRQDTEEAAALHENEIAGLQEELCRMKAEFDRVQVVRNEYDMEVTALRAEIEMKKGQNAEESRSSEELLVTTHFSDEIAGAPDDVATLQEELSALRVQYQELNEEYQILQESNKVMVHQLERLEALKYKKYSPERSRSNISHSLDLDAEGNVEHCERRYSISRRNTLRSGGSVTFKSVEIVGVAAEYDDNDRMEIVLEENEQQLKLQEVKKEMARTQILYSLEESESREQLSLIKLEGEGPDELKEADSASGRQEKDNEFERIEYSLEEPENQDQPSPTELGGTGPDELKEADSATGRQAKDNEECDQAQIRLREMELSYQLSQTERELLHEELRLCKEEIERLNGTIPIGGRIPAGGMKPLALFAVLAGALILYPCLKRCTPS